MNCPKCKSDMAKVEFKGIEIDRCTNCSGIWFDILEEEDLKKIEGSERIDLDNTEMAFPSHAFACLNSNPKR